MLLGMIDFLRVAARACIRYHEVVARSCCNNFTSVLLRYAPRVDEFTERSFSCWELILLPLINLLGGKKLARV